MAEVKSLLSAAAVRERAHEMLRLARRGELQGWTLDEGRLPAAADLVAEVIRGRYPDLHVPFHARWRHFVIGGVDLWKQLDSKADWNSPAEKARAAFDLAIVSVLLDAGAGMAWRYHDVATGSTSARSEGLAVASIRQFQSGAYSGNPRRPLRADAVSLQSVSAAMLSSGFQVTPDNPLVGLEGRAGLLQRLGARVAEARALFGLADSPRPGGLFDVLAADAVDRMLPAARILERLLEGLGPIWQGRLTVDGVALGDTWRHPQMRRDDATDGLVPLHKLSQWLAYSLIEPLQEAGLTVTDIDGLTGLAEYRNGGLFLDGGVLAPSDPGNLNREHDVGSPFVVAWRALTVALLDEIAPLVRDRLGVGAADFPLARILEGGTWTAGRRLAAERRADGGPPLKILSDGTVF